MTIFRLAAYPFCNRRSIRLLQRPVFAQQPNVSDITGSNVSDITGSNVSDITGSNVSDITRTNPAGARRASEAGFSQADVDELANSIGTAYTVCAGGGDCAALNTLLDQSSYILTGE